MLHQKIKALREYYNYTQDDLAIACNVSRSAISNWENDRRNISHEMVKSLASIFNVSIIELLDDNITVQDIINKKNNLVSSDKPINHDQVMGRNKKVLSVVQKINTVLTLIVTICLLVIIVPELKENNLFYNQKEGVIEIQAVTLQLQNVRQEYEYEMTELNNDNSYMNNANANQYYSVIIDIKELIGEIDGVYFAAKYLYVKIVINKDKRVKNIFKISSDDNFVFEDIYGRLVINRPGKYQFIFYEFENLYYIGAFIYDESIKENTNDYSSINGNCIDNSIC